MSGISAELGSPASPPDGGKCQRWAEHRRTSNGSSLPQQNHTAATDWCWASANIGNFLSFWILYLFVLQSLPRMFKDCPLSLPCITSTAVLPVSSVRARCRGPFQPCFAHILSHTMQGRKDAALSGSYTWRLLGAKQDCLQRAGKGSPSHSPGSHMLWHRTPQGISVLQKVP